MAVAQKMVFESILGIPVDVLWLVEPSYTSWWKPGVSSIKLILSANYIANWLISQLRIFGKKLQIQMFLELNCGHFGTKVGSL